MRHDTTRRAHRSPDCGTHTGVFPNDQSSSPSAPSGPASPPTPCSTPRSDGFADHLDGKAQVEWEVENAFSIDLSDQTRARLSDFDVTAIVCGNDFIAIGAMRALHELGRSVPQDVSVVGFDDIPWAGFSIPGLTTVHQLFSKLGIEAAALLIRRIMGDDAPQVNMSLDMRLVTRGSLRNASTDS